tara:strand:+ start:80 stop:310 length:231 start_codon:yes stop_codon:yes gene_type:complete
MSDRLIADKVFRLKKGENLKLEGIPQVMEFNNGEEFHIVAGVLYMKGFPLPGGFQRPLIEWILNNPKKFIDDTRIF